MRNRRLLIFHFKIVFHFLSSVLSPFLEKSAFCSNKKKMNKKNKSSGLIVSILSR